MSVPKSGSGSPFRSYRSLPPSAASQAASVAQAAPCKMVLAAVHQEMMFSSRFPLERCPLNHLHEEGSDSDPLWRRWVWVHLRRSARASFETVTTCREGGGRKRREAAAAKSAVMLFSPSPSGLPSGAPHRNSSVRIWFAGGRRRRRDVAACRRACGAFFGHKKLFSHL